MNKKLRLHEQTNCCFVGVSAKLNSATAFMYITDVTASKETQRCRLTVLAVYFGPVKASLDVIHWFSINRSLTAFRQKSRVSSTNIFEETCHMLELQKNMKRGLVLCLVRCKIPGVILRVGWLWWLRIDEMWSVVALWRLLRLLLSKTRCARVW